MADGGSHSFHFFATTNSGAENSFVLLFALVLYFCRNCCWVDRYGYLILIKYFQLYSPKVRTIHTPNSNVREYSLPPITC